MIYTLSLHIFSLVIHNFDLPEVSLIGHVHTTGLFCALVVMWSTLLKNRDLFAGLPGNHRVIYRN